MPVVRDLISTVNRLTQPGSPAGAAEPNRADAARAADPDRYVNAGIEPALEDLLDEPIVQLVMRADDVEPADIRRLFRARRKPPARTGAERSGDRRSRAVEPHR